MTFRGEIFHISPFIIGEPGEPYCTIPEKYLKLLNKFLRTTINNSKIEFCEKDENLLFLVDKEHYRINIRYSIDNHPSLTANKGVILNRLISF